MATDTPYDTEEGDPEFLNSGSDMVFGIYSFKDWLLNTKRRHWQATGISSVELELTFITPAKFKLVDFTVANFKKFTFSNDAQVCAEIGNTVVSMHSSRGKLTVEFSGDYSECCKHIEFFTGQFKQAENLIQWVYNARGNTISVPLNYRPAIASAYPWIEGGLDAFFDDYLNSDACILILLGPPGVGKTSLLKNLIHRSGGDAKVAYDAQVINSDGFFAEFIEDETRFLILEDSDNFLKSRQDGNNMMHKFLNVSDGLVSAADKKLVFTTNLPSVRDIDEALTRPGRCYAVVEFRELTIPEAEAVINETGKGVIPDGVHTVSLAKLLANQNNIGQTPVKRMGFF